MKQEEARFFEVCKGCSEIIYKENSWDSKRKLCSNCIKEQDTKLCLRCGKNKPEKKYWGNCKECFTKRG